MKITIIAIVLAAILVLSNAFSLGQCFSQAKQYQQKFIEALNQKEVEKIIDAIEPLVEKMPELIGICSTEEQADQFRQQIPPACAKILAKEAKILVKIMRLYADDAQKNQKLIILYSTMFETLYKTQVQKKCPFLKDQEMFEVKNKGECAEGAYRFSLVFQNLDHDLALGNFNASLNDMGKVVEQLPLLLTSCNQDKLAHIISYNFPKECLASIGGVVRQIAQIEHHYTHFEWLQKHLKDFTKAIIKVRDTCPILSRD